MGASAKAAGSRALLSQARLRHGVGMRAVSGASSKMFMMSNQRFRYFSSNEEKKTEEAAGEPKAEPTAEPEASQEPPKEEERAQGGGSFLPLLGGLALLGGAAVMFSMSDSGAEV